MASSDGSTHGSSFGTGSLGSQPARTQHSVETFIDRNWQFDQGQHKSRCRIETAKFAEQSLKMLAKSREPGEHDGAVRQATIERLQALLRDPQIFPAPSRLQLVPYGSFLSSCYSRSSDLDLALTGEVAPVVVGRRGGIPAGTAVPLEQLSREECVMLLVRLAYTLEAQQLTHGSVDRNPLGARVPIIKFEAVGSGIECDVCVTTRGCDFKSSIMRSLYKLQPSLAPLIQLVKLWAKHHDINSAHCSTLNSWSLALMVVFSLQSYPGGHLLPPLWRIFHDEEPTGPAGKGRPLQDKSLQLNDMLVVAEIRCTEEADHLLAPRWSQSSSEPPGLLDQLLWFLSCFSTIMCQWRDNSAQRNWRVSTWLGRGYTARFPKAYVAAVEEPFDCNDNTARSLGTRCGLAGNAESEFFPTRQTALRPQPRPDSSRLAPRGLWGRGTDDFGNVQERNEHTLSYVAWVFGHSLHLLRNVSSTEDAARALTWLFGAEALPCVGLERLKVPAGVIHKDALRQLETMEAARGASSIHPHRRTHDGETQAEDGEEAGTKWVAEYQKRLAIRAFIDATKQQQQPAQVQQLQELDIRQELELQQALLQQQQQQQLVGESGAAAGQAFLEALRGGSQVKDQALAAADRARAATEAAAAALAKVGLGPTAQRDAAKAKLRPYWYMVGEPAITLHYNAGLAGGGGGGGKQ
ncbi:hypothetical protein VOLCADRAFT_85811 [Volvox carteri f. nagariensis]|uniref:Uncharacterized protein mot18 n=1 Tax=Volvox carteri f. nagariensis TaxID=3068 RepID=D8TH21_VOLCA|nr:uncharacterized protein VOLCADRAFT_85811 [Volvox carteri f. nagariensis]EFJ52633.1 hypothetical protein VOLCADRAFT_85811 [Volvox carteri f. nagariensis]|eukprot:XP_002945638.1 hypothetical protein VOLCADRAFT_85811 [Volvox carteri f. nagariensis]